MRSQEIGSQEMSSQEIGSSLISFELTFEALRDSSTEFKNSKSPEFNLGMGLYWNFLFRISIKLKLTRKKFSSKIQNKKRLWTREHISSTAKTGIKRISPVWSHYEKFSLKTK